MAFYIYNYSTATFLKTTTVKHTDTLFSCLRWNKALYLAVVDSMEN